MTTLPEVLQALGLTIAGEENRHVSTGWVGIDCPYCGPGSGKFHLGFNKRTGAAACWRCGPRNPAAAVAKAAGISFDKAKAALGGAVTRAEPEDLVRTGSYKQPRHVRPLAELPAHQQYLRDRGFDWREVARLWGVGGLAQAPRLGWRLFIPWYRHGRPVSWVCRSIGKDNPRRYLGASAAEEAVAKGHLLYGSDYVSNTAIVHEGPLDVWATGPGAVATGGTGFTENQIIALSNYPIRVICFDAAPAAQRRAERLADALAAFPGQTYNVRLETGDDTAAADPAEVEELRRRFLTYAV